MSFKQILGKIKKTLDRPLAFTAIKFKTSFLYKKNLKNPKYETKLNKALNKKERIYLNYFKKHYSYVLNIKKDNENNLNEKPYIFIFWYQGFDKAPELVKTCVESIKKHGCEYKVVLLDKDNFNRYIDIPQNIKDKLDKGLLAIQNFSDYLRIKLLAKYNCLWIDSTVFAFRDIPLDYSKWSYFSIKSHILYKDKPEYLLYPDFPFGQVYLLGGTNKRIYNQIALFFEDYLRNKNTFFEYFQVYYFFQFLYKYDDEDKKIIDSLPYNNEHIEDYFYYRNEKFNKNYICDNDVFAKLTYKIDATSALNDPNSLLYHIINENFE